MSSPVRFGKYQLLERIAIGGMAEIYKARLEGIEGFHRTLAIKRILPHLAQDPDFIGMLVDEAKIAGLLSHANIVQILDLGQVDEQFFIAMEFVQGRDLGQILARAGERGQQLPVRHALHVAIEMLKGLEYAHDRQVMRGGRTIPLAIVHRDISPANVLVSLNGEVKITDFGIAKASVKAMETVAGVVKGRFDYMSPEQSSGARVDRRADLFATGVVLYEMLTGRHPFRQASEVATIDAMRRGTFTPPSQLNPEVSAELDGIVARALRTDPEARYAAAGALRDAVERVARAAGFVNSGSMLGGFVRALFQETAPAAPPVPPSPPVIDEDEISLDEETGWPAGQTTRPFPRPQPSRAPRPPDSSSAPLPPRHGGGTMPLGAPPPRQGRASELPSADTGTGSLPLADTGRFGPVAGLQDESTYVKPAPASAWADAETVIKPDPSRPAPAPTVPPAPARGPAGPAAPTAALPRPTPARAPAPAASMPAEAPRASLRAPRGLEAAQAAAPRPAPVAVQVSRPIPPPAAPREAAPPAPSPLPAPSPAASAPAPAPVAGTPLAAPPPATPAWQVHGLWAVLALTCALLGAAAGAKIERSRPRPTDPVLQVVAPGDGTLSVDGTPLAGGSPFTVPMKAQTPVKLRYERPGFAPWEVPVTLGANQQRILDLSLPAASAAGAAPAKK